MFLLSTYSLKGYGFHKIGKMLKGSGFDGIDLYLDPKNFDVWDLEYIKLVQKEFGTKILSISTEGDTINKPKALTVLQMAKELKVQLVTFSPPFEEDITKYLQEVKNEYDFNISISNIEKKYILYVIPKKGNIPLNETKNITGYTSLDLISLDNNSNIDIINAINILGSSLKNVYLSDKKGDKYGIMPGKEKGGISNLPIESFLMKLKSNSYNGFITLKVDPEELGVGNEELMKSNFGKIQSYYNKYYKNFK